MARTQYDILSTDRNNLIIQKAVRSVEFRLQTPNSINEHILSVSNQTLTLVQELSQQTIHISPRLSFTTIDEPWKLQVLEHDTPMISESERHNKVT